MNKNPTTHWKEKRNKKKNYTSKHKRIERQNEIMTVFDEQYRSNRNENGTRFFNEKKGFHRSFTHTARTHTDIICETLCARVCGGERLCA